MGTLNVWSPRPTVLTVGRVFVEVGPMALVTVILWAKLVQIGMILPSVSWAGAEPPTLFAAVRAYPDMFTATLACLLAPMPLLLLLPRFWRLVAALMIDLALTALALGDLMHVRFYADVTSISALAQTAMLTWVVDSVLTLLRPSDALYFADIVVGLLALGIYARRTHRVPPLDWSPRVRLGLVPMAVALLLALPTARLASAEPEGIFGYSTVRLEVASAIGILPYHVTDLAMSAIWGPRTIGDAELARARHYVARHAAEAAADPSPLFGAAAGRNLIVISAESIQAFVIGLEVDGQLVAPRLTALARESLYLANNYEPTHLGSTADAEFAVMQSLYPLPVGVVASRYARNQYRGLPAVLAERGYATFAAVGAMPHFWNMNQLHPRYGFQQAYYEPGFQVDERIAAWISDRSFFGQMLPALERQPEPFMGFLLSSSSHHPYEIPEREKALRLGPYEGTAVGNYLHAVHYFDRELGAFVDGLAERGLLDRTVLAIYGDHQGFLGNEPELPRLLGFDEWNEYHHFRVVKRTPVLIRLPGGAAAAEHAGTSSHLDVAPTLLSLLGVEPGATVMLGRDLTRSGSALAVFRDGSFATDDRYFVNRFGRTIASRCYVAETGARADCEPLLARQREARERLEVSDSIVQGDLIPVLLASQHATEH